MPSSFSPARFASDAGLPAQLEALDRDGLIVLEGLIDSEQRRWIRAEAERLADKSGANAFEGHRTQRVYAPLSKTRALDEAIAHPRILALLDALLLPNYLLSQAQIINILPGEAAQPLHHDDGFCRLRRPHPTIHTAFVAAIDEFTADNGATAVIPGSHRWGNETARREDTVPCLLPAGDAVFFLGALWHGGGANRSDGARLAVTGQYCEPWIRQQENFFLELSKAQALALPEPLRSMVGFSIHPPFMGMVDRHHPRRVLER